jgi:hypothetical protein
MRSVTPLEFAALEGAHLIDVREPAELEAVRTEVAQPLPIAARGSRSSWSSRGTTP